jgi:hypothetical protein
LLFKSLTMQYNIFCNIIFAVYLFLHPIHVSIAEFFYNKDSKTIEITHKIYLDDLEDAINAKFKTKYDILKDYKNEGFEKILKQYLMENLEISIDGTVLKLEFIGKELDGDAMWCYYEIKGVKKIKIIEVSNSVLMDFYEDQVNILNVNYLGKKKSLMLSGKNKKDKITF